MNMKMLKKIITSLSVMLLASGTLRAFDTSIMQDSSIVLHGVFYIYDGKEPVKSYERCVVEKDSIWDLECSFSGGNVHIKFYSIVPDTLRTIGLICHPNDGDSLETIRIFIAPLFPDKWDDYIVSYECSYDSIAPFKYLVEMDLVVQDVNFDELLSLGYGIDLDFITFYVDERTVIKNVQTINGPASGCIDIRKGDDVKYVRYYTLNGIELQKAICGTPLICHMYGEDKCLLDKKILLLRK